MPHLLSDLMTEAQRGNQRSYHELLSQIIPLIESYLQKRVYQKQDVQDITQICLLAIHKNRHTYDPKQPFENWMYGIVKYKMLDHLRQSYKKQDREIENTDMIETFFGSETNKTKENARKDLETLMLKLPKKQQKIIYLLKIEGYSIKEVAKQMAMSPANVKVTSHRAFNTLKNIAKQESRKGLV